MITQSMLRTCARVGVLGLVVTGATTIYQVSGRAQAPGAVRVPVFEPDPSWPKLPNNWVMATVTAVAVDSHDHVWILHRPGSLDEKLKSRAAPPVVEFDADGRFVNAWGGPGAGYEWFDTEHGITVDHQDNVWLGGAGGTTTPKPDTDDILLKFTNQGKFLKQIGRRGQSRGNADTNNLNRPSDVFVDAQANEIYVADGYGNRRVIVLDADTGAFKRMWGAFGNPPDSAPPTPSGRLNSPGGPQAPPDRDPGGTGPTQFGIRVHGIKVSKDRLVYVGDRINWRLQVFTTQGKYVAQTFINRGKDPRMTGSVSGFAFSADPEQQFLYVSDLSNSHIAVLNRKTLEVLYQFGAEGTKPGEIQGPHLLASDSKGNLYVAEVAPGNRAQKFVFKGLSSTLPPNALTAAQLAAGK